MDGTTFLHKLKNVIIGKARSLYDEGLLQKISLVTILAWVGLGADGLSSSCYGPEEAFRALGDHKALSLIVTLMTITTITVICASYSQIIEVFPGGGGGYLVASKLLSPKVGVVSGCALLVDYVLTIAISISSGADAIFSLFPTHLLHFKMLFILFITGVMILLNLRGYRESVIFWLPIFFIFLITHTVTILGSLFFHTSDLPTVIQGTFLEMKASHMQLGWAGVGILLLQAYSVGAGTYTGIEAVSNGLPILKEPRVETGKRTMIYMGVSLALTVGGLMFAYLIFDVEPEQGKTLNALLFEKITATWPLEIGASFVFIALLSAMILLFIAAQTGFLDGPRVLAIMALDRWVPGNFASLSDRLVTQNGVIMMGLAAIAVLILTRAEVSVLVVLYSINVFITFSLSQLGMVRHWWMERKVHDQWLKKITINGLGLCLTAFILITLVIVKFKHGGWLTLLVTGLLIAGAFWTKHHYLNAIKRLSHLDDLLEAFEGEVKSSKFNEAELKECDPHEKTAVMFVNGYNGLGIHSLLAIMKMFPNVFKNFIFIQAGVVDVGVFKGVKEVKNLEEHAYEQASLYASHMRKLGYHSEVFIGMGTDAVDTLSKTAYKVWDKFPNAVFFGGQLVFEDETFFNRFLHNHTVFLLQKRFFQKGVPFLILPIRA